MSSRINPVGSQGALDYGAVRLAIAEDLSASISGTVTSVARLVGDLREEIQGFLDRGGRYRDVARVFEGHGVEASPDAIRVALRRAANMPLNRAKRKVVTSKPKALKRQPQVEGPLSPSIPDIKETSPGSDRRSNDRPPAEPILTDPPVRDGPFSSSAPSSSAADPEPAHDARSTRLRASVGRHLD